MSLALLLKQAVEHHRNGKLDLAEDIYKFLGEADAGNAQVWHLRGLVAQELGRHEQAIERFRRAMSLGHDRAETWFQIGRTQGRAGDATAAMAAYREVLAVAPARVDALCNLANLQLEAGAFDDARVNYERALALAPDNATIHYNLGTLCLKRFQPAQAASHFEAAIRLRPDYANAHNSRGAALAELGATVDAAAAFRKASELAPTFIEPLFNLHGQLLDLGDIDGAIACMQRAVDIDSSNADNRFFLGMLQQYGGDEEAGTRILEALRDEGRAEAEIDSWGYLRAFSAALPAMTGSGRRTFELAIARAPGTGRVLEFGVYHGKSIRQIAAMVDTIVHGFDSFEGIPEDWGAEPKGSYSTGGRLPEVPANVRLHPGWFENSLPEFLRAEAGPVRFVNVDCDLYGSTRTVLDLLAPRMVTGSVVVFDEFIGYETWREDEYKAFHEAVERFGWTYEVLCFSFMTRQVAVTITVPEITSP